MSEDPGEKTGPPENESALRAFHQAMTALSPRVIVTPAILMANIVVFAIMVATGVSFFSPSAESLLSWGANFGPMTMNGQWWRLLTCLFLHFGILHLAMNMFILWGMAQMAERLVGRIGFGILYLASGISASLTSLAWHPAGISAGASGAVFGTAGALLGFVVLRRDTIPPVVRNQLLKNMALFLFLNTMIGMSVSRIDSAAHVGGLVGGLVCGLILSQPLSAQMIARRPRRNLAAAVSAVIGLTLAALALPAAPVDIVAELQRFADIETQVYREFNALEDLALNGVINDDEHAERLQYEILPPWIEARERIEGLVNLDYVDRDYVSSLAEFMRCREESWKLLAEGLREQDASRVQQAKEKSQAADKMAEELSLKNG